ncbi:MAG: hypothetical protein RIR64_599 [Bacteroidota bacterium]
MIPTNVNNLTIKEFIEYENIRTSSLENIDKIIQIASSFTDISVSEYENMSFNELEKVKSKVLLLINSKPNTRLKNTFWHDGTRYKACKDEKDFKTNQYTALKQYETDVINNLHKILALIYVKCPLFSKYKFNSDNVEEIGDVIYNYGKVGDVYGTLFFYSNRSEKLKADLLNSLEEVQKEIAIHMEEVNRELKASEKNMVGTL